MIVKFTNRLRNSFKADQLQTRDRFWFTLLGMFLLLMRCGLHPGGLGGGNGGAVLPALLSFPKPMGVFSEGIVPLSLLKILQIHTLAVFTLFHLVLTLIFCFTVLFKISGQQKKWRSLLLFGCIFSPVAFELLNLIGIPDIYTIIGWCLFLIPDSKYLWFVGVILVSFTNTPQTPISVVILIIYYFANPTHIPLNRLVTLACTSIPGFLAVEAWLRFNHQSGFINGNGHGLLSFLSDSGFQFIQHMPNSLVSCYGIFWIPIVLYLFDSRGLRMIYLTTSLILIPLFFSVVVIDATRVFTNLVFPAAVLAVTAHFKSRTDEQLNIQRRIYILIALFSPINYYYAGIYIKPFQGYLTLFRNGFFHHNCANPFLTSIQQSACRFIQSI